MYDDIVRTLDVRHILKLRRIGFFFLVFSIFKVIVIMINMKLLGFIKVLLSL
jgi:hypothetical protein